MISINDIEKIEYFAKRSFALALTELSQVGRNKINLGSLDLYNAFKSHYTEIFTWAYDIPFIGLNRGKNIEKSTVELNISSKISKYGIDSSEYFISEFDLLTTINNIIILGKPGAGKTTTIKRLLSKFFQEKDSQLSFTTPILIRLRELKNGGNIYSGILGIFNFSVKENITTEIVEKKHKNGDIEQIEKKVVRYLIKGTNILVDNFIVTLLDKLNAIVFLDGFDEISVIEQRKILQDLRRLGLKLNSSKIILTSRTSSINNKVITGYDMYEIYPLDAEDIKAISDKWFGIESKFIDELYKKKYYELANRPIYLSLLLVLYEKNKTLPEKAYEIYRDAVYLILKDWDESRDIDRSSEYAGFTIYKKLSFIQEIAFNLTYKVKSNTFSSSLLFQIYSEIHDRYNLPESEAGDVVSEIESHNGLISEAGNRTFQFSHLTLQEYLCAEYINRIPYTTKLVTYFYERPDPLAIAICISPDSGSWFANLLLNESLNMEKGGNPADFENSIIKLLTRLIDESPAFNKSFELGAALIYLIAKFQQKEYIMELILSFLMLSNVSISLKLALEYYSIHINEIQSVCILKRDKVVNLTSYIKIPLQERIYLHIWRRVEDVIRK